MKFFRKPLSFLLAAVLLFSAVPFRGFAKSEIVYGIGYVDASSLRLRSSDSTSSSTITNAARNEVVVVLEKDGDWCKVLYNLKEGYMHTDYLDLKTKGDAELGYGKINGSNVNLRSGPGTSYSSVVRGNKGDKAYAVIYNERLGLGAYVAYDTKYLPRLLEWKSMKSHDYVLGLEPCNTWGVNRAQALKEGKAAILPAYSSVETDLEIGILDGVEEIRDFLKKLG